MKTYSAVIIASALSGFVTEVIAGVGPEMEIIVHAPPLWHYSIFIVLGLLLGAAGVLFKRVMLACLDGTDAITERQLYLFPLAFAVLVGARLALLPDATGGGDDFVYRMLHGEQYTLGMLVLILIVRSATTCAASRSTRCCWSVPCAWTAKRCRKTQSMRSACRSKWESVKAARTTRSRRP